MAERAWSRVHEFAFDDAREMLARLDMEDLSDAARLRYAQTSHLIECFTSDTGALLRLADLQDRPQGDAQTAAAAGVDRMLAEYLNGGFETCYAEAMELPLAPIRLDLWLGLLASLRLRDGNRLRHLEESAADSVFRGRSITLIRRAAAGAVAALEDRRQEAVKAWTEAVELADQVWTAFSRAVIKAEAASYLGTDAEPGRSWGREAFEMFRDAGAMTMLDMFADGLVADDVVSDDAATG